jgi:hypothetical protein
MNDEIKYLGKTFKNKEEQWEEAASWPTRELDEDWFENLFKDQLLKMKEANESLEGLTNQGFLKTLITNITRIAEEIEKNKLTARTLLRSVKEIEPHGFFDYTHQKKK